MSDSITTEEVVPADIPQTVSIGGKDYTPEEAQELVGLGSRTREYEQRANTKLDRIYPEYTKLTQEKQGWMSEKQALEGKLNNIQQRQGTQDEQPGDVRAAIDAARKLGITLNEDLEKSGYIKKDDLPKYFEEYYTKKNEQEDAIKSVLDQADKLSTEINGEDGRPKFNKKQVLAYASAYKLGLKEAYEDMHDESLKAWKDTQVTRVQKPGARTLQPTAGGKSPKDARPNQSSLKNMVAESLGV